MASRTVDIEIRTGTDEEGEEETEEFTVNADAITQVYTEHVGPNEVWWALAGLGAVSALYLFLRLDTLFAVGGTVLIGIVLAALMPVDEDVSMGTVTRHYDGIVTQPSGIANQFSRASQALVTYESVQRGILSKTTKEYYINPETAVSIESRSARNWRRALIIWGGALGLAGVTYVAVGMLATIDPFLEFEGILRSSRLPLAGMIAGIGALAGILQLLGDDQIAVTFESGRSIRLNVPSAERDQLIEELRSEGSGNADRLVDVDRGKYDLHVNVDNVSRVVQTSGELLTGGYLFVGLIGLLITGSLVGLLDVQPLLALGAGGGAGALTAWILYPRSRTLLSTLVSAHSVSDTQAETVKSEFESLADETLTIADVDEGHLRRFTYDEELVIQNIVYLDRDEQALWPLLVALVVVVGAALIGYWGIEPLNMTLGDRLMASPGPTGVFLLAFVGGILGSLRLLKRIWHAWGPPEVLIAFKNGETIRRTLSLEQYETLLETFRSATDTVAFSESSRLGRDREREFNVEELLAVTAHEYEYYPKGFLIAGILWVPILYLGQFVFDIVWLAVFLLVWAGLVLWKYNTVRFSLLTPIGEETLSATEADRALGEMGEASAEVIDLDGRITGLTVHDAYRTTVVPDNVVSYRLRPSLTPGAFLYVGTALAILGAMLIHHRLVLDIFDATVGGVLSGWLRIGVGILIGLLVLGILFFLAVIGGGIHGYDKVAVEDWSGDHRHLAASGGDADTFETEMDRRSSSSYEL